MDQSTARGVTDVGGCGKHSIRVSEIIVVVNVVTHQNGSRD